MRNIFLDRLACVRVFVGRDCDVLGLFVIYDFYTEDHGLFELVVEFFWCCFGGRRVGVGRVEGVLLVCLVKRRSPRDTHVKPREE